MDITLIIIFGLLGLAVGSFLNVVSDRLPAGKSLLSPPSFCDSCQKRLAIKDLIPVVSFILLRRRCRYCGALIPYRVPLVETGTGLLFGFLYWYYGLSPEFAVTLFYCCVFIVILVIDLEHQLILNKIVYPCAIIAVIVNIFMDEPGIIYSLIGGATGLVLLLIPALISRGGMGWGDVKMAALIGLVTGFPQVFIALFIAVVSGGLFAVILLVLKVKKRKEAIPFGPFLAMATIITLLWGSEILNWYLSFFSL